MSVWILTSEYNDYDQHGEYFEGIWFSRPLIEQLKEVGVEDFWASKLVAGEEGRVKGYNYIRYTLQEVRNPNKKEGCIC